MFAMLDNIEHGERRKTISNVYAKSYIMTPPVEQLIQEKTRDLMKRIGRQLESDLFLEYHFLGCDIITRHVYGPSGETFSLAGKEDHMHILDDIIGQPKSDWIWSSIHFPAVLNPPSPLLSLSGARADGPAHGMGNLTRLV